MLSLSLARQSLHTPFLARAASTATAPKPAPKRTYTPRSTSTTYKRPASRAAVAAPVITNTSLPVEDDVPEEALVSPSTHTLDSSLPDPSPLSHSTPIPEVPSTTAAWEQPGVSSTEYPSAAWRSETAPAIDWTTSFHGLSAQPFSERAGQTLMRPLTPAEIEIKPGKQLIYLCWTRVPPASVARTRQGGTSARGRVRHSPPRRADPLLASHYPPPRWPPLPPRNSVSPDPQPGLWSWRLGHGPAWRDDRHEEHGLARVGAPRRWQVSTYAGPPLLLL